MSSPLEKGRAKGAGWICPAGASFYVADNVLLAGNGSHAWHELLRLSPHLFWLGLFTHRAFSSAQDDDTGERMGSYLGDTLHVLELAVLYYDTSSPLEKGRAKGAGWICPAGASFYVADNVLLAGIISHAWYEILRLSPHLFWLGLFSHRAFSSV